MWKQSKIQGDNFFKTCNLSLVLLEDLYVIIIALKYHLDGLRFRYVTLNDLLLHFTKIGATFLLIISFFDIIFLIDGCKNNFYYILK